MNIVAEYNFNHGKEFILEHYKEEFNEIVQVINSVDALQFKVKESYEKTMQGKMLFSPSDLNKSFKKILARLDGIIRKLNAITSREPISKIIDPP